MILSKKLKIITRRSLYFLASVAFATLPYANTYAASRHYSKVDEFIDTFSSNNVMFYNPLECEGGENAAGSTILQGSDTAEKIWNYFIGKGFNDIAAAGLLGNAMAESSLNVVNSNGSTLGIFQWLGGRRTSLEAKISEAGLSKYIDGSYVSRPDDIPPDDYDKLLQVELDFAMSEEDGGWQDKIKQADSPEEAAEIFLTLFERAVNGDSAIQYYEPFMGQLYQGTAARRDYAKQYYDLYSGSTGIRTSGTNGLSITDGSNVTWIGDSLSDHSDVLKEMLPNVESGSLIQSSKAFNYDSSQGGTSGMNMLKALTSVRDILIFALGTNDSSVTEENMQTVLDDAKSRGAKLVVFMTARTTTSSYDDESHNYFNTTIRNFAENNSDVLVADWSKLISKDISSYLGADGIHQKGTDQVKEYFQLFIDTVNKNTTPMNADECCDPKNGSDTESAIWDGTKYEMTDAEARGIISMIMHENGSSVMQVKTQASQMANRFDQYGSSYGNGIKGLINYVKTSGWYDSGTGLAYDESYSTSNEYMAAVKSVLVEGKRVIPPEVVQHATGIAQYISASNEGTEIDVSDRTQFKSGVTKIHEKFGGGAEWIFYAWADPEDMSGDPFGYEISNPPKGNSSSGSSASACCARTVGNVTLKEIGGVTYAFPLAGATQANYLNPGYDDQGNEYSVLSPMPCEGPSYAHCHHDYEALDMGINMEMASGKLEKEEYGFGSGFTEMYYYSSGATIVAFTGGTIEYVQEYGRNNGVPDDWVPKCGQIALVGDNGHRYWMGHLDLAAAQSSVSAGQHVEAGDVIAKVGAPQCAQNTQAHIHIQDYTDKNSMFPVMNELYESLSTNDGGTGVSTCGTGSLPEGGMTLEEAQAFMKLYNELPCPQDEDPYEIIGNSFPGRWQDSEGNWHGCGGCLTNCSQFSLYFINRYTSDHRSGVGNGSQVAGQLIDENNWASGGSEPKVYAVFSEFKGANSAGHTGVVLGIDEANDQIIIGEAGCPNMEGQANVYSLSAFRNSKYTYAYSDGKLK